MRKSNLVWVALVLITVSGCKVQQQAVFVDIGQAKLTTAGPIASSLPNPPPAQPASSQSLASRPAEEVVLDSGSELARVKVLLDQDRRRARRTLVHQYVTARNSDIDEIHQGKLQSLKALADKLRVQVADQIRASFVTYADKKGPLLARLTTLETITPRDRTSPDHAKDMAEAVAVRTRIAGLDARYLADRKALQSQVRSGVDQELTRIQSEIAGLRVDANDEASAAADKQLAGAHAPLPPPKAIRVQLKSVGGESLTVPGTQGPVGAPSIAASGSAKVSDAQLLQDQLQIWAKTRGYLLRSSRDGAVDKTIEFLQWIKARKIGR